VEQVSNAVLSSMAFLKLTVIYSRYLMIVSVENREIICCVHQVWLEIQILSIGGVTHELHIH
jgi:hypothetical protein